MFIIGEIVKVSKLCAVTFDHETGYPIAPIEYFDFEVGDEARVVSEVLHLNTNSKKLNAEKWHEVEFLTGRRKGKRTVLNVRRLKPVDRDIQLPLMEG